MRCSVLLLSSRSSSGNAPLSIGRRRRTDYVSSCSSWNIRQAANAALRAAASLVSIPNARAAPNNGCCCTASAAAAARAPGCFVRRAKQFRSYQVNLAWFARAILIIQFLNCCCLAAFTRSSNRPTKCFISTTFCAWPIRKDFEEFACLLLRPIGLAYFSRSRNDNDCRRRN